MNTQQFFESFTHDQVGAVLSLVFFVFVSTWAVTVFCMLPFSVKVANRSSSHKLLPKTDTHSLPVRMMLEIVDKEGWMLLQNNNNYSEHITYKNLTVFVTDTKIFAITDYTSTPPVELKRLFTEKELASIHPKYLALRKSLQDKQDKTSLTEALTKFTKALS